MSERVRDDDAPLPRQATGTLARVPLSKFLGRSVGERQRVVLLSLLAFVLMVIANLSVLYTIESARLEQVRGTARYAALDAASDIQVQLNQSLSTLHLLAALVRESGGEAPNFERVASQMLPSFPAVTALQLAPGGVIQRIVPMVGNERALGHDLLKDPAREIEAHMAVRTRQMTLAGPFALLQGGEGMVGRMPVFLRDQAMNEYFWGFVTALIKVDDLMRAAGIEQLRESGYDYLLTRNVPGQAEMQTIASSASTRLIGGESLPVVVPNGEWTLSVAQRGGWGAPLLIVFEVAVSIFVAALVGGLTFLLLHQPLALRRQVRLRTAELEFQATHDNLTGLANRTLLCDRAEHAMRHAKRGGQGVALLLVDLDRFKTINDSLGHSIGDQLLVTVSRRLTEVLRDSDTLSRLGGDEFVIVIPDVRHEADVAAVCDKLVHCLAQPARIHGAVVYTGGSIGVAMYPRDGEDAETLLRNADAAMYLAKESGRGRYRFYESALNDRMMRRFALEAGLREALARSEFEVHYQPKVSTRSGRIEGAEALLRWNSGELGLVSPTEFIPLAEETGLIVEIGEWVLGEACRQLRLWRDAGHQEMRLAVNLSALQFRQRDLARRVSHAIDAAGIPAASIELELTESMVMENATEAVELLDALRALGVSMSLDDFGTGQSNLSYLKRFPIDTLKIDQSFVRGLPGDADDAAITRAIIAMGRSLGLNIVAEGVELPAQQEFLRLAGCEFMQGYLYARPMPAADFEATILPGPRPPPADADED